MTFSLRRNIAFAALLLSACAAPDPSRVQVTMMGTKGVGRANEMVARAGDSAAAIAKNSNLDIADLLSMNGLVGAGSLKPGQLITTPLPSEVTVLEGDSVDTISRALGIDKKTFVTMNNLQYPYILTRGQVLKVPQGFSIQPPQQDNNTDTAYLPPIQNDMPVATTPITTTQNAMGQKVHSSASGTIVEEDLAPPPNAKMAPAQAPMQMASIDKAPSPVAQPSAKLEPLPSGAPKFSWPLNGSTVSDYGRKADGQMNDGIDIGAPQGTTVRTAAMGDVVYVGDNVAGFGNLILIKHGGGYATAYGHVQSPLVKRGDRVAAGQAIAQVGKTGNVGTPQLHFEVRKGTQAVNPNGYLN